MTIKNIGRAIKNIGRAIRLLFNSNNRISKILLDAFALSKKSKKNEKSYSGEFFYLEKIMNKLNINNGYIVDVAAGDGYRQSCTLGFFKKNWEGLCIEMNPARFSILSFLYQEFSKVNLLKIKVTPLNIHLILEANNIPKNFDLLNLDIDSYDLEIMSKILKENFRPKVVSMEINEKIPPPIFFNTKYDENDDWTVEDNFYGCSITAAADVLSRNGYIIESLQYNNLICLRKDLANESTEYKNIKTIYNEGYKNKSDRTNLFPWNKNVDCLLNMEASEAMNFLDKHFYNYRGKYNMYIKKD